MPKPFETDLLRVLALASEAELQRRDKRFDEPVRGMKHLGAEKK